MTDDKELIKLPLPDGMPRMESGPVQFGDDWPGIFLRGDNAVGIGVLLDSFSDLPGLDAITRLRINSTAKSLMSCRVKNKCQACDDTGEYGAPGKPCEFCDGDITPY